MKSVGRLLIVFVFRSLMIFVIAYGILAAHYVVKTPGKIKPAKMWRAITHNLKIC